MNLINYFVTCCSTLLASLGPLFGFLIVYLESIIPPLPLSLFVALNVHTFGLLCGIIISWLRTCCGSFCSYSFFYYLSNKIIYKHLPLKTKLKVAKALAKFTNIKLSNLVVILALPFTPAFLINIIAGMASIKKKKFILALLIGKLFMIIFWGYIGKSLIDNILNIKTIFFISLLIVMAYTISKYIGQKANLE